MRNVETNWSRPNTSATLMFPTILVSMKSRAYADSTTYSRYQLRKATVVGKAKLRYRRRSSTNRGSASIATYASFPGGDGRSGGGAARVSVVIGGPLPGSVG